VKKRLSNPIFVFVCLFLIISIPLCTLPIQLFPGVIEIHNDLQHLSFDAPLSLAYFIGLGMQKNDLEGISAFYLKPAGYMLAFIFTIGIPALVAFRISLKKQEKKGIDTYKMKI